ncbi:hypothetical protein [Micromonospora sp. WMMD737]|uniref:hypothetical protein n=1 Tax=Micromonospora sp. WMMD737 TaxID=3404113 RepID=UPI003B96485B
MGHAVTYGSPDIEFDFPPGAEMPDRPFFTVADLAVIGARVHGVAEPLKKTTISQYLFESGEEIPLKAGGTRPGKYADDPFPKPDDRLGKAPWWDKAREPEIVAWFERHPRRQVGDGIGGRKPSKAQGSTRG